MADLSDGVDGLREDMALHQRRFAPEVTDSKNHAMAADAIERLEREQSEAKPVTPSQPDHPEMFPADSIERREVGGKKYLLKKESKDTTRIRKASAQEHHFFTHAMPRVELLLTKMDTGPLGQASWHQRTMAVLGIKSKVPDYIHARMYEQAAELEVRFLHELIELLNDSNRLFGPWEADAGTRPSIVNK